MTKFIIDDSTPDGVINLGNEDFCATLPRDYAAIPYGSIPGVGAAEELAPKIPMEQWPDLIADRKRKKTGLREIWRQSLIGVWNQASLRYCHSFSTGMGIACHREQQGMHHRELSPSSIAAPITGYQNRGWYISDALKQARNVGIATIDFVKRNTIRKADFLPGWEKDAERHRVEEWYEGRRGDVVMQGTLLLTDIGYIAGYDWWGHAIWVFDIDDVDITLPATNWNRYSTPFLNSWGEQWGDGGIGALRGQRAIADSFVAVGSVRAERRA